MDVGSEVKSEESYGHVKQEELDMGTIHENTSCCVDDAGFKIKKEELAIHTNYIDDLSCAKNEERCDIKSEAMDVGAEVKSEERCVKVKQEAMDVGAEVKSEESCVNVKQEELDIDTIYDDILCLVDDAGFTIKKDESVERAIYDNLSCAKNEGRSEIKCGSFCIDSKVYTCHYCEYTVQARRLLIKHIKDSESCNVGTSGNNFYTMGFESNLKLAYTNNNNSAIDIQQFKTKLKNDTAKKKRKLPGEILYSCDKCDFVSHYGHSLKRHSMKHDNVKPYGCDICDFTTGNNYTLKEHKVKHTNKKRHKCDICYYSTNYSYGLKVHKMKHLREKPYQCNKCDYKTVYKYNLKVHMLVHDSKAFKCDKCVYASVHRFRLKQHKLKHGDTLPYQCCTCSYATVYSNNMKVHMKKHLK